MAGTTKTVLTRCKYVSAVGTHHHADWDSSNSFAAARTAFEEGLEIYKQNLTSDPQKRRQVDQLQASSIKDVLDAVNAAGARYKSKRTGSKVRECLTAFSRRVCHYGNIMDVMVQHHPEYVSLAWGAMKLLFGVSQFSIGRLGIITDGARGRC